MRDVSERSKVEQERKEHKDQMFQTQKMEAISRLTGGVAQDFDALLSDLRDEVEKYKTTKEDGHFNNVHASIRKAQDLVDQLLSFSHKKKEKLHAVDVGQIIKDVHDCALPSLPFNVTFLADPLQGRYFANTNEDMMQKIILNLSLNAIEAVGNERGKVAITVKEMDYGVLNLRENLVVDIVPDKNKSSVVRVKHGYDRNFLMSGYLQKDKDYLHITVSDSGHGIEADILPNVFDPFFSTKMIKKGAGLGLSTVQGIVTSGGGAVVIETVPRQGTNVHVFLLRHETNAPVVSARA